MRTYPIELVTQYKEGKEVKEQSVQIFSKPESVARTEFYSSYAVGLNPRYVFTIWTQEYSMGDVTVGDVTYHATHLRYNGELFKIIRVFSKSQSIMQITVG